MVKLMFWIACGILAAIIASKKGQSGFAWFFIVLMIGLILPVIIKALFNK